MLQKLIKKYYRVLFCLLVLTCVMRKLSPGPRISTQEVPDSASLVTPIRTRALPSSRADHTKPVGPTLSWFTSQPTGVAIAVHFAPSGDFVLTPVRNMTYILQF